MALGDNKGNLPPGPGAPAVVQSVRFYRDPYGFMRVCQRKYGDCFTVRQLPCGTIVFVADPEAVRELFSAREPHVAAINSFMAPVLGRGLFLLDGEEHARERRWMAPAVATERMRGFVEDIATRTSDEVATWPLRKPFALRPRFEALALGVILRAIFGSASERVARLAPVILRLKSRDLVQSVLASLPYGIGRWKLSADAARNMEAIDHELNAELADRRAGGAEDRDVLAALRSAPSVTDRAIRDEVMTLIFAGHDTVASTLAWTFERIVRHPAVAAALQEAGDDYLDAVLLESMRMRPTVADIGRVLAAPLRVGNHTLPAGTHVCIAVPLIHARSDLYRDPEVFRPERFLDNSRPKPWVFMPFGGGARRCIGEGFAMIEMRTILRTVASRARLEVTGDAPERGVGNGVTINPHKGALVVLEGLR